jgi:hypothetical protein
LLGALKTQLEPHAEAAGFRLTDETAWADLAWLEYRRTDPAGVELLDVFYWPRYNTIVAELWRPASLAGARRRVGPEVGADRRAVWHRDPDRVGPGLVTEIATVLAGWLEA